LRQKYRADGKLAASPTDSAVIDRRYRRREAGSRERDGKLAASPTEEEEESAGLSLSRIF